MKLTIATKLSRLAMIIRQFGNRHIHYQWVNEWIELEDFVGWNIHKEPADGIVFKACYALSNKLWDIAERLDPVPF